jgi:hypothetical protein
MISVSFVEKTVFLYRVTFPCCQKSIGQRKMEGGFCWEFGRNTVSFFRKWKYTGVS